MIPTDDLIVGVEDERSNARTLAKAFLPAGGRVVPIASPIADHKAAGNAADARLQDLPWPPDLVWLSVGKDGNAAGILAGPDMQDALDAPKARRAVGVCRRAAASRGCSDPRLDPVGAHRPHHRPWRRGPRATRRRDPRWPSSKPPIGRVLAEAEQPIDIHWVA